MFIVVYKSPEFDQMPDNNLEYSTQDEAIIELKKLAGQILPIFLIGEETKDGIRYTLDNTELEFYVITKRDSE